MLLVDGTTGFSYVDITGTVPDAAIPALIARDQEVADAVTAAQAGNRARPNHTGTQPVSSVTGLQAALDARAPVLTQTTTKTGNYTAAAGQAVPLDTTSGTFTLTLPSGAAVGSQVAARWAVGAVSPIVSAPPGETIGTAQTVTLTLPPGPSTGEFVVYQKWSSTVWLPSGGFKPQSALAAVFVPQTQRGPVGGVVSIGSVASGASVTPDGAAGSQFAVTAAAGGFTLNAASGATEGQVYAVFVAASGGNRTVTYGSGVTAFKGVAGTNPASFTVSSGKLSAFLFRAKSATSASLIDVDEEV